MLHVYNAPDAWICAHYVSEGSAWLRSLLRVLENNGSEMHSLAVHLLFCTRTLSAWPLVYHLIEDGQDNDSD